MAPATARSLNLSALLAGVTCVLVALIEVWPW